MSLDLGADAVSQPWRGRYRPLPRGDTWRALSLELRVVEARCACCGRCPSRLAYLEGAHLVAERELFDLGPGVREAYLLDRRGVVPLCRRCHLAFDALVVGVRDPRRLGQRGLARLRRWRERHRAGFRRLALRRERWRAVILREVDALRGAGAEATRQERD